MSDLDPQDDDVLRERLGRLASSAARSVPSAQSPERIRRRGTARRNRRTAAGLVSAGLAVAAVAGIVSEASALHRAPVQPARTPSVPVTSSPSRTRSPSPSVSPSVSTSPTAAAPDTGSATDPATSGAAPSTRTSSRPAGSPATALPWVADPWNKGYEFGFVWGAKRSGDVVVLTFDRAGMLLGEQAKAYYDAHPDEERFDYKILNDSSVTETMRVSAAATLYGNQVLGGDGSQNVRITLDRLTARASGGDRHKVAVWLKRSASGRVVYLAEQYLA